MDKNEDKQICTPVGKLSTVHHCLKRKYKRKCTFVCEHCEFKAASQGELNDHHTKTHRLLKCSTCDKEFKTPSAFRKH